MTSVRKIAFLMVMTVLGFLMAPISTWATQDTLPTYLEQEQVPTTKYHLTARPWLPMGSGNYLDVVEGIARWWGQQEDPQIPGRILEPFGSSSSPSSPQIERGALPLSLAILYDAGRARDLLDLAIRVMDYETKWYADKIMLKDDPETLLFSNRQVAAFEALSSISAIPTSKLDSWRNNLFVPTDMLSHIMTIGGSPNSYCYRMLAE